MAQTKTKPTAVSVEGFLATVASEQRRADSAVLIELMSRITGKPPHMWGPSIIGFDTYHYRYASGHEGDAPLAAFSPRKTEFSIYLSCEDEALSELLARLGKHRMAKACLYVKKLADIDLQVLEQLIRESVASARQRYG